MLNRNSFSILGFILYKVFQNLKRTSKVTMLRSLAGVRGKCDSVLQLQILSLQQLKSILPSWICKPVMYAIYTYNAYIIRLLHAGRTKYLLHKSTNERKQFWFWKTQCYYFLKAFHYTVNKFIVQTKILVLWQLYYLVHSITVALSQTFRNCTTTLPSQVSGTPNMAISGSWAVLGTYGLEIAAMGRL